MSIVGLTIFTPPLTPRARYERGDSRNRLVNAGWRALGDGNKYGSCYPRSRGMMPHRVSGGRRPECSPSGSDRRGEAPRSFWRGLKYGGNLKALAVDLVHF